MEGGEHGLRLNRVNRILPACLLKIVKELLFLVVMLKRFLKSYTHSQYQLIPKSPLILLKLATR